MIDIAEKAFEVLENTKLNWTVRKEQLFTEAGLETDSFGIFRNDTNDWLGTVGKQYRPFQNWEMAEALVKSAKELDLDITRGGALRGGKKIFMQIPLEAHRIGADKIKRYITCLNTHDGTSSIAFGSTNQVVSCSNTFHHAYRSRDMSKFRHSSGSKAKVEEAISDMRVALGLDKELMKKFDAMADISLRDEIFAGVLNRVFDIDLDKKESEYSTRKLGTVKEVSSAIEREIKEKGSTLWGLFNGITYYTNHVAPHRSTKEEHIMTGSGYETNRLGFEEIMKWTEEELV